MTGEEAWFVVDQYIDSAILAGVHQATVIHGTEEPVMNLVLCTIIENDTYFELVCSGLDINDVVGALVSINKDLHLVLHHRQHLTGVSLLEQTQAQRLLHIVLGILIEIKCQSQITSECGI